MTKRRTRKTPKSTVYEQVVARIVEQLEPNATVEHDAKLQGFDTETIRQIDVAIGAKVAGIDILTIVQCKDYSRRVDVNRVHELVGVMKDVRAHRGVLVANSGFSKAARTLARRSGIDLWTVHDGKTKDWRLTIRLPVITRKVSLDVQIIFESFFMRGDSINVSSVDQRLLREVDDLVSKHANDLEDGVSLKLNVPNGPFSLTTKSGNTRELQQIHVVVTPEVEWYLCYYDELPKGAAIQNQSSNELQLIATTDALTLPEDAIRYRSPDEIPVSSQVCLQVTQVPSIVGAPLSLTKPVFLRPA